MDYNVNSNTELDNFQISVGAEYYNLLSKTGAKVSPQQFKEFEKNAVKFIYNYIGLLDVDDSLCNFTAFINSYLEALTIAGASQAALEKLQNNNEPKA